MIKNDQELQVTLERVARFKQQVLYLRQIESNPVNYKLSVSGYLAEIARMNIDIQQYLSKPR